MFIGRKKELKELDRYLEFDDKGHLISIIGFHWFKLFLINELKQRIKNKSEKFCYLDAINSNYKILKLKNRKKNIMFT